MHLRYGFDTFNLEFELDPDDTVFRIVKLKDQITEIQTAEFKKYDVIETTTFEGNQQTGKLD
jgi:hypothetical protein